VVAGGRRRQAVVYYAGCQPLRVYVGVRRGTDRVAVAAPRHTSRRVAARFNAHQRRRRRVVARSGVWVVSHTMRPRTGGIVREPAARVGGGGPARASRGVQRVRDPVVIPSHILGRTGNEITVF